MTDRLIFWWRWQLIFGILFVILGCSQVTLDAVSLAANASGRGTWAQLVVGVIFVVIGIVSIVAAFSFRKRAGIHRDGETSNEIPPE